jgi:hypothetical protein
MSALITLPFTEMYASAAISEALTLWAVRDVRCRKNVGSWTETEMRRNEVMALVFCSVGSCPVLLQSRPQPVQQRTASSVGVQAKPFAHFSCILALLTSTFPQQFYCSDM